MSCMALRTRALVLVHCCEPSLFRTGRWTGVGGAVFLNQVEPRQRNVELGLFGEFENHELDGEAVLHDFLQALVLRDAVLDVNDVVADGQIAEVGDEGRGLGSLRLGARGNVGVIGEIVGAEDDQVGVGKADARGQTACAR